MLTKEGDSQMQLTNKMALLALGFAGLFWWLAALSMNANHAWADKPAEQPSPIKLKEICSFEKKDGDDPERFLSVVFAPEGGQRVYTTSFAPKQLKAYLRCWDIAKRQLLWERTVAEGRDFSHPLFQLTIEPKHGRWLAFNDYEKIQVWEARDFDDQRGLQLVAGRKHGDIQVPIPKGMTDRSVHAVRFAPDGKTLAAVYAGPRIMHWGLWHILMPTDPPKAMYGFSPLRRDEGIKAWDETCNELRCLAFAEASPARPNQPILGRAGNDWVLAVAGNYQRIAFWDLATDKKVRHWEIGVPENKNNNFLNNFIVFDLEPMRVSDKRFWVSAHGSGEAMFYTYGRAVRFVFQDGQSEGFAQVWSDGGAKIARCSHQGAVVAVAVAPNDMWFVTAEFCKAWKLVSPKEAEKLPIPRRGKWVDMFDLPSRIYIWDTSGRKLAVGEGHTMGVTDVAVSPDGKLIASCSADGTLRLWEVPEELR